jgi:hypothetical protein
VNLYDFKDVFSISYIDTTSSGRLGLSARLMEAFYQPRERVKIKKKERDLKSTIGLVYLNESRHIYDSNMEG